MTTHDDDHPILFIPGPVEVDRELREIMAMPLIGHRSAAVKERVIAVCDQLKAFYRTAQHAFFENTPATALMEAGIRNLVERRSLHLTCGAFSERWFKIAHECGREPVQAGVEWGQATTPDLLRRTLAAAGEPFEAVCMTHSETSTGVLNPIADLARVVREESPDTMILVDVVTSVGGAEVHFDDWGLDLAFAGTQKCLALPPGLATYAVSERAVHRASRLAGRGFLLDFAATPERFAKGETPATPCVPLLFALSRQLERIAAETLEARWARHLAMRDKTIAWGEAHGCPPFVAPEYRSPTVTTLRAEGAVLDGIIDKAKAAGFSLGKGYGKLKSEMFRVGHMGDHTVERVERLLAAIS